MFFVENLVKIGQNLLWQLQQTVYILCLLLVLNQLNIKHEKETVKGQAQISKGS